MALYLKHEFHKAFSRHETWIALVLCAGLAVAAFLEMLFTGITEFFRETSSSPEYKSMLCVSGVGSIAVLFFVPLLASVPAACSYAEEKAGHAEAVLLTRGSRRNYFFSKAVVIALTAFVFSVLPFLINYLLCLVAYPSADSMLHLYPQGVVYQYDYRKELSYAVFPELYMNAPVLCMAAHMLLIGLWGVCLAELTYAVSLFYTRNLLTALLLPLIFGTVLPLIFSVLGLSILVVQNYFLVSPVIPGPRLPLILFIFSVLLLGSLVLLLRKAGSPSGRDIL